MGCCPAAKIKESLLPEAILAKLPSDLASVKEIIFQRRPITITMIRECLNSKCQEMPAPSAVPAIKQESALKEKSAPSKQSTGKDYPQFSMLHETPSKTHGQSCLHIPTQHRIQFWRVISSH
ncbi:hypothetical protein VP01_912g2 [Puccinia sorghi]|uniref:Uncharacterized protein n=1 Tax=Puccinia sorghi TaxID=27349 RepID=A0A0L6U7J7_9BASI|nr:hypothetical protein VP01_912g2 [Puccinia sorghi]